MFPATRTTRGDSLECAMSPNDEPTIGLDGETACTFTDWIEAEKSRSPSVHHYPNTRKD